MRETSRRGHVLLVACLLVVTGIVAAGCGRSDSTDEAAGDGNFVVGAATAQTGFLAFYDQAVMAGFELRMDQLNDEGGIETPDGTQMVEVISKDTRSDPAKTTAATQELLSEGADLIILPCDQDLSVGGGQLAQEAGVPAFSSCATQPTIPGAVGDFMFLNSITDNANAAFLANYVYERGDRTAFLLGSPDYVYTETWPRFFAERFEALGGEVVGEDQFSVGQQDFSSTITKIKNLSPQPDVIMTSAYEPEFPPFLTQLRAAGVDIPVVGNDGLDSPTVYKLGDKAEGVTFPTPGFAEPGSNLEAFYEEVTDELGADFAFAFTGLGADLALILQAAAAEASPDNHAAFRDAIANLEDVEGVTSNITYAGQPGYPERTIYLVEVRDGAPELVEKGYPEAEEIPQP